MFQSLEPLKAKGTFNSKTLGSIFFLILLKCPTTSNNKNIQNIKAVKNPPSVSKIHKKILNCGFLLFL